MKKLWLFLAAAALLSGCATREKQSYDYTALKQSKPKSILVVMPQNNSVDVKADVSVLARATYPLAELGYYVYPVAVVDEMFKQNGVADGGEIASVPLKKIHQIFGADAVFYTSVNEYGTQYKVFDSITTVDVVGKLVDAKTGNVLWEGSKKISQGNNRGNEGLLVALISAAINQIIDTSKDRGYQVAAPAMGNLVVYGSNGGLLVGPRHPAYNTQ